MIHIASASPCSAELARLCRAERLYGMLLTFAHHPDVVQAAPYLEGSLILATCGGYVLGSAWVIDSAYRATVGDDGPTATNAYAGPARVYAVVAAADGSILKENT